MWNRNLLAITVALLSALPAAAQIIYEVDTAVDSPFLPCTPAPGDCPLRSAIFNANNDGSFSQIILMDGTHQLTIAGANEDNNATGDLDVLQGLEILAAPGASPVIEQTTLDRVFEVHLNVGLLFRITGPITITGGQVVGPSEGGGIAAHIQQGGLELEDVVLIGNEAESDGGCLWVAATQGASMSLHRVTLTDCHSQSSGGGAYLFTQDGGQPTITSSLIEANTTYLEGGGVFIRGFGSLVILDTTIRGNLAGTQDGTLPRGGGIYHGSSSLVLRQSTVTDNQAGLPSTTSARGGGIYAFSTTFLIENSTISGNRTSGNLQEGAGIYVDSGSSTTLDSSSVVDNPTNGAHAIWVAAFSGTNLTLKNSIIDDGCSGSIGNIVSSGFNVERPWEDGSTNTTCNLTNPSDLKVTDLMLRPLAGYGGPTDTHALMPGSPAQFLVSSAQCQNEDQRHAVRAGLFCDSGAYNGSTVPPGQWIFADGFESGDTAAWSTSVP
jgi:hypothetical protein